MNDIEFQTRGRHGEGLIRKLPTGARRAEITFHNGKEVQAESLCVDLEAAKAKNLQEAVEKACHALGYLPLFEKTEISGTQALVIVYRRPGKVEAGYATIIKRGENPMKFKLNRVDLIKMKSQTVLEALKKVAFETGAIRLFEKKPLPT